jgi:hypothetical protein
MRHFALAAALVLFAVVASPSAPHAAAQNTPVTMQCQVLRGMQWLDNMTRGLSSEARAMVDQRERIGCGMGVEAQPMEYWPNGGVFRSGDQWYYPHGGVYYAGNYYFSNGGVFATSTGEYYYPNGGLIFGSGNWYAVNGGLSSETGIMSAALPRLSRQRGDELLGYYRRETDSLWRMIYLTSLAWEGR